MRYLHSMVHMLHVNEVDHHHDILVALSSKTLLSFVDFRVKLINFDGVSKRSAVRPMLNF